MIKEATPAENYQKAKKNRHNYSISTEAFSTSNRQFVVHNISLKKDYVELYDIINYRRGLSYIEEIVDFKHSQPTVARKGLRKFKDLLPQYLDIKESHVNTSRFHNNQKGRIFKGLHESNFTSFVIYNTEKLNGENAQISYVYDRFWVIGSKNKALILSNEEEIEKLKNKHEHKLTILIAKAWFNLLKSKAENEIEGIKSQLSKKTLIGEYCNSENMQHLIDYGKQPQLFFYALVQKDNLIDDCQATSTTFKFLDYFGLPKAKCQIIPTQSFDQTIEKLRQIVIAMNELTMKEGGEGGVVYVSGIDNNGEHNSLICKVKTIQYRIYRKLREKLKVYIQKFNKNYENLLKKFTKEIAEIARQFQLNRPLQTYIQIAKRSFILCEDQSRPISRFVSNRFIHFLRLVEKNTPKEKFLEIVNSSATEIEDNAQEIESEMNLQSKESEDIPEKVEIPQQRKVKKVIILIPVTIPSTGKSSLLDIIEKKEHNFRIWSISSDEVKRKIMDELRKKKKTMTRDQAFQKSRDPANKEYYKLMGETFKNISLSKEENHVFYLDKNHPQNALKKTVQELNERSAPYANIKIQKLGLFPLCIKRFQEKGTYRYPYSAAYMLSCLKRVSNRQEHLTLEGSTQDRIKIVFGFANFFRNFSLSPFNIKKYFDDKIEFQFNNEQCLDYQKDAQLIGLFKDIILSIKPGSFEVTHKKFELFVEKIKKWNLQEQPQQNFALDALKRLQDAFQVFGSSKMEEEKEVEKIEKIEKQ